MSERLSPPPLAHALLRCRSAAAPALQNEAAARWTLRHVAFNSGFELRPAADMWVRARARARRPGFTLDLDMRDGRFLLLSRPAQRCLELQMMLGPGARHLRRNLPRLVDEFAAACLADVISFEFLDGAAMPVADRQVAQPLVRPAA